MITVLDNYDSQMMTGEECGRTFLTFILQLKKATEKTSTMKLTRSAIEPGPAGGEATTLPLDPRGGLFVLVRNTVAAFKANVRKYICLRRKCAD